MILFLYILSCIFFLSDLFFLQLCSCIFFPLLPFFIFLLVSTTFVPIKKNIPIMIVGETIKQICLHGFYPLTIFWFYSCCLITSKIAQRFKRSVIIPLSITLLFVLPSFLPVLISSWDQIFTLCTMTSFIVNLIGIFISLKWLSTVARSNRF